MMNPMFIRPSDILKLRKGEFEPKDIIDGIVDMMGELDLTNMSFADSVYSAARKLSAAGVWKRVQTKNVAKALPNLELPIVKEFLKGLPDEMRSEIADLKRESKVSSAKSQGKLRGRPARDDDARPSRARSDHSSVVTPDLRGTTAMNPAGVLIAKRVTRTILRSHDKKFLAAEVEIFPGIKGEIRPIEHFTVSKDHRDVWIDPLNLTVERRISVAKDKPDLGHIIHRDHSGTENKPPKSRKMPDDLSKDT